MISMVRPNHRYRGPMESHKTTAFSRSVFHDLEVLYKRVEVLQNKLRNVTDWENDIQAEQNQLTSIEYTLASLKGGENE